jgi:hypothetical protein
LFETLTETKSLQTIEGSKGMPLQKPSKPNHGTFLGKNIKVKRVQHWILEMDVYFETKVIANNVGQLFFLRILKF